MSSPMGLLLSHKRKLRIWPDMMSVSCIADHEQTGGGKRGQIQVFSKASRYRLFRLLHSIEFKRVTFITLTYPSEFPTSSRVYKAHLKEYRRRFEEKWGERRAVWRLEFQERMAPHFHIMYFDCPFIPIKQWCRVWHEVIHSKDPSHLKNGVDLKLITNNSQQKLIASYVGKYISKVDERLQSEQPNKPGRQWGYWNLRPCTPCEFEISDRAALSYVSFALGGRSGGALWQPLDPTICTVFGSSMGRGNMRDALLSLERSLKRYTG